MIEARVHAPTGGRAERGVVYGTATLLVLAGLVGTNAFPIASTLLTLGFWIWLVSPFVLRRRKSDRAAIVPQAGKIRIRGRRSPPRTIRTQSLVGASVARNGDGAVVTLCERGSVAPVAIEVANVEAADQIRSSLGIPHAGFGEISWNVQPTALDSIVAFARIVAAVAWTTAITLTAMGAIAASAVFSMPAVFASVVAVVGAIVGSFLSGRVLHMGGNGIVVSGREPVRVPYSEVTEIVDDANALVFRRREVKPGLVVPCVPTRWLPSGLSSEERSLMIAQLRGALAAAHGEFAPFVDPTSHLDQLRRRDAPASEWLARLDALAALQSDAAYRGAAIAKEDLWRALESHDAAPDLRAGAARVLLRISAEKEQDRIAHAIDSVHDDTERAHIRAALRDDVVQAAAEIEATAQEGDDDGIVRRS